ncbi:MAG: NADH-quinone oxidoreductase subunit N [Muribaculaceae bacterium]|nr:NADH-quinone oxidoreductase subunit N [Muribaculaceae bacterium]
MDYSQFLMMPQEIGLLLVFLLVFVYDTFMPSRSQRFLPYFTAILFCVFMFLSFIPPQMGDAFGGMFEANPASWMMKNMLNVGVFIVLLQAIKWSNEDFVSVRRGEFYELLLLTLFGMYLMMSARHFLLFVIGLETASLPIAALTAFEKRYYESHEAAAKYIFTAIFSSAIFMLGVSFVYGLAGSLYFNDIAAAVLGQGSSVLLVAALAFVIAGLGYKLSLVPFHQWTPDVYQGAPTAVTSYLSVISKGAAAFAFMVILVQAFGAAYAQVWQWMLYVVIILTITIGNLFAIRQRNMKRFLAYSSISQAGYIMLGVIAASTVGMASMMYYILVYIFSNLAAFGVIAAIERQSGKVTIDDYNGLFRTNPWMAFTMMLAMFSLGGIPPFAGFFSKFFIFVGAAQTGSVAIYVLVFIALVNTIISLYYYLLVVKAMFIRQDDCAIPYIDSHWTEELAMTMCVLAIVAVGLASGIYTFLSQVTDSVSHIFAHI